MFLVPCTMAQACIPMHYAGRDRFKASLDHTASSHQQPKKLARKLGREHIGTLQGSQAGFHNWKQEGGGALTPTLLLWVVMTGIEVNIPVTYGIGSQRRDQSTGCQFIGQSPVHAILAACRFLLACWVAVAPLPLQVPASTPDNSSPTGTSGHFHMELLLQRVGAMGVRAQVQAPPLWQDPRKSLEAAHSCP